MILARKEEMHKLFGIDTGGIITDDI